MLVNAANLDSLRVGFKTSFQRGVATAKATTMWSRIATLVPATTKEQKYGWLGRFPRVREWIGPRALQNLMQHDYSIKERPWELTVTVDKDDIETDNLGIYTPMFEQMGQQTEALPDQLIFALLLAGFSSVCYDGQYFFDTDHPVIDKNGVLQSKANTDGGSGTPWFLLDTRMPLKPLIYQRRKDFDFVAKDRPTDDNVFFMKEFVYGADARANVGFGFWQQAWGSKQTLDADHYKAARAGLSGMTGDHGNPLGLMGNLLLVPPSLESAARKLLNSEYASGGETNEWKGTAELLICPWLASEA
jgi:phage major head subunit gpT-like protein